MENQKNTANSIRNFLENTMYSRIMQTGKEIDLIIMHPQTWHDLLTESHTGHDIPINPHDPSLKYKGIRVLRSFDIVKGLFEVR